MKTITIMVELERWLNKVKEHSDNDYKANYPNLLAQNQNPQFTYSVGKRWIKILRRVGNGEISNSVFCFIDPSNGDIYKAATSNMPAKGVRGNITEENAPLTEGQLYR